MFKFIASYYRWLYRQYNKVGVTAGNKVLVNNGDGSYRSAGWKGQVIGNVVVCATMGCAMYHGYRLGKTAGAQDAYWQGRDEALEDHQVFEPIS